MGSRGGLMTEVEEAPPTGRGCGSTLRPANATVSRLDRRWKWLAQPFPPPQHTPWRAARNFTVEVAGPACVVTPWHIGPEFCALLNPANRGAGGRRRFCSGDRCRRRHRRTGVVLGWGGMDAGPHMLYPSQVVDGSRTCKLANCARRSRRCRRTPTASAARRRAVLSEPFGRERFTDPHAASVLAGRGERRQRQQLASCYTSSILALVQGARGDRPVAVASLLVGGRGGRAAHAAAEAPPTRRDLGQRARRPSP